MAKKVESQRAWVLSRLKGLGPEGITSMEAFQLCGITRLASIICNLRKEGYNIRTINCVGKNRFGTTCNYAMYVLEEDN